MSRKLSQPKTLEEAYREILGRNIDVGSLEDDSSLEQPYLGRVVHSVTTYSVHEKPLTQGTEYEVDA